VLNRAVVLPIGVPSDPHASKRDCRLCPQRAFGSSAWAVLNSEQAPYRRGRKMKEARQMTPMRVALRVPVGRHLPELATFIGRCEEAGLHGVGSDEHDS